MDYGYTGSAQTNRKRGRLRRTVLWAAVIVSAVCAGAFFFYAAAYRVRPAFSAVTYELGDAVSVAAEDYLLGTEWSVRLGEVDVSQVDAGHIGTYPLFVRHGREEFCFEIVIADTQPPEISSREGVIYLAEGRPYAPEDLIAGVRDADSRVMLSVRKDGEESAAVCYDCTGRYQCDVVARDFSGNQSVVSVPVVVDGAPVLEGVENIYIALGNEFDYLSQVTAWDETDGDLTDRIAVDDGGVLLSREGTYRLTYRVEDNFGIDCVSYADVTVVSEENLQEMIGTRCISRESTKIIGAANPYDAGASEGDDIQEALEYVRPALVQLYVGSESNYNAGSGYIMEITDSTVYICSNRHVVEKHDSWNVYFYDGTRAEGVSLGCSNSFDVGVVAVARDRLPEKLQKELMTVHIDQTYWSELNDQRIDVGLERVDRKGGILHVSTGTLIKVKQHFAWYDRKEHTEVTLKLDHGDSGSAVLDGHGNLIGMAYAYSTSPRRYWCIPLDGILECYQEITGRSVYVY